MGNSDYNISNDEKTAIIELIASRQATSSTNFPEIDINKFPNRPDIDPRIKEDIKNSQSDRKLREKYANRIIWGIFIEIILAFILVVLAGFNIMHFENWILSLLFESTLIQSFLVLNVVVKYLFGKNKFNS